MMLRRIVTVAGWGFIVLLPLMSVATFLPTIGLIQRSADRSASVFETANYLLQAAAPALLFTLAGIGIGAACLLLVSMDRRLERLEEKA